MSTLPQCIANKSGRCSALSVVISTSLRISGGHVFYPVHYMLRLHDLKPVWPSIDETRPQTPFAPLLLLATLRLSIDWVSMS